MRLELLAAGNVPDFGPVKRTELRESLSEGIGVPVEKIALSVEAASVRLHFSVSVEAEASITLVAEIKAALPSATAASAMLGVEVLRTPLLTLDLEGQPPQPHRDPTRPSLSPSLNESASHMETSGGEDSSLPLLLVGAGALLLAALVLLVAAFLFFRSAKRDRPARTPGPPNTFLELNNIAQGGQHPAIVVAASPFLHEMGCSAPLGTVPIVAQPPLIAAPHAAPMQLHHQVQGAPPPAKVVKVQAAPTPAS